MPLGSANRSAKMISFQIPPLSLVGGTDYMLPANSYILIPAESLIKVEIICYQNFFLVFGSLIFLTDNQLPDVVWSFFHSGMWCGVCNKWQGGWHMGRRDEADSRGFWAEVKVTHLRLWEFLNMSRETASYLTDEYMPDGKLGGDGITRIWRAAANTLESFVISEHVYEGLRGL